MIPAAFEYHAPTSVGEAAALLAKHGGDAKVLSGGQSLIPMMKLRLATPRHVVDINHVSLVASRKRARAVAEALLARGVPAERLGRLKAPAGLDLGAVTPEEIAVSILAEIVRVRRSAAPDMPRPKTGAPLLAEGLGHDPVGGMSVEIAGARHTSEAAGRRVYFCCAACKQRFDLDPARYALGAPA